MTLTTKQDTREAQAAEVVRLRADIARRLRVRNPTVNIQPYFDALAEAEIALREFDRA
jgi:hypothetical protein